MTTISSLFCFGIALMSFGTVSANPELRSAAGNRVVSSTQGRSRIPVFSPMENLVEIPEGDAFITHLVYAKNERRNQFRDPQTGLPVYAGNRGPTKFLVHKDCRPAIGKVRENLLKHNESSGHCLKLVVYDAVRPCGVQAQMFKIHPDPKYVAPCEGQQKAGQHNRGMAVDIGLKPGNCPASRSLLVDRETGELDMGSPFDAFNPVSHTNAPLQNPEARKNRDLLLQIMESGPSGRTGMKNYKEEWWHYMCPTNGRDMKSYAVQP